MSERDTKQIRTISNPFTVREDEKGGKFIEGYFAVFDSEYNIFPGATESVDRHAFDDQLNADVRCLIDHDTRLVVGRTKAGTLTLKVDDHGLWGSAKINEKDVDALNVHARVERGDVDQCSFGFEILDEDFEKRDDGTVHWTIRKVKLYEVSICTFPAYTETAVSARKADLADREKRETEKTKIEIKTRLEAIKNGTCTA